MFYPYSKPEVLKEDINAVVNALKSGYLTQGDQLEIFQKNITDNFDCNYSAICNSGTAALHLVYSSLGLDSDNGLLTSPITFLIWS